MALAQSDHPSDQELDDLTTVAADGQSDAPASEAAALRPLDPEAMELLELFTYTQQKINDHLEKVFAVDHLSLAHYRALFFVLRYDGISVSGLIDKLDITKQSLARVLADLIRGRGPVVGDGDGEALLDDNNSDLISEAEGFLYSEVDPSDRRARRLHLTERGLELMHTALAPVTNALKDAFGQFTSQSDDTKGAHISNLGDK